MTNLLCPKQTNLNFVHLTAAKNLYITPVIYSNKEARPIAITSIQFFIRQKILHKTAALVKRMAGRKKAWEILVCLHLLIEEKRDRVIVSIVKQPDMALSYSRTAAKGKFCQQAC